MSTPTLHDLRVLDLTTTIAGPHCTRLLADLGARVVKIESPEGDLMRTRPPLRDGASSYFGQLNAGKRSVVLDLKQPAAVDVVKRLVPTTDVLVENFRPGVMQRLGLDYAALAAVQPRADLLRHLRLRPERPVGGPAGVRAGRSTPRPATTWRTCPTRRAAPSRTTTASSSPTS